MILVGFFVLRPLFVSAREKYSQETARQSEIIVAQEKLELLSNMDGEDLKQKLNQVLVAIPREKDIVGSVAGIRYAAAASGVVLDNFSSQPGDLGVGSAQATPSAISSINAGASLKFAITVLGTGEQVKRFIEQVESILPYISVKSVEIGGANAIADVDLTAESYHVPDTLDLGPVQTPLKILSPKEEKVLEKIMALGYPPAPEGSGSVDTSDIPVGKENPFQ